MRTINVSAQAYLNKFDPFNLSRKEKRQRDLNNLGIAFNKSNSVSGGAVSSNFDEENVKQSLKEFIDSDFNVEFIEKKFRGILKDKEGKDRERFLIMLGKIAKNQENNIAIRKVAMFIPTIIPHICENYEHGKIVPDLVELLELDENSEIRMVAAYSLIMPVWMSDEKSEAIPALGQALQQDKNVNVRRISAFALGDIEDRSTIGFLKSGLLDKDFGVRMNSADALGKMGENAEPSRLLLIDILAVESNYAVRMKIIEALVKISKKPESTVVKTILKIK